MSVDSQDEKMKGLVLFNLAMEKIADSKGAEMSRLMGVAPSSISRINTERRGVPAPYALFSSMVLKLLNDPKSGREESRVSVDDIRDMLMSIPEDSRSVHKAILAMDRLAHRKGRSLVVDESLGVHKFNYEHIEGDEEASLMALKTHLEDLKRTIISQSLLKPEQPRNHYQGAVADLASAIAKIEMGVKTEEMLRQSDGSKQADKDADK